MRVLTLFLLLVDSLVDWRRENTFSLCVSRSQGGEASFLFQSLLYQSQQVMQRTACTTVNHLFLPECGIVGSPRIPHYTATAQAETAIIMWMGKDRNVKHKIQADRATSLPLPRMPHILNVPSSFSGHKFRSGASMNKHD